MSVDAETQRNQKETDIVAGLATFAAMSYIIFTNPAVLEPTGMAPGPVLLWTCIIAFAATAVAARTLDTPTALACGMGLNLFFAQYACQRQYLELGQCAEHQQVPWEHLLATCFLVSLLVFGLSLASARRYLIAAIPPQIFAAIKAGVGSLLVKVSVTEIARVAGTKTGTGDETIGLHVAVLAFLFGLAIILIVKAIYVAHLKRIWAPRERTKFICSIPRPSHCRSSR
jgi:AGZA family xanthine/uracil permease-like MFS transporter